MKTHHLKTWPEFYNEVISGRKTFEVRKNDRKFKKGDDLILKEYDPLLKEYSGRKCLFHVSCVMHGGKFGLEKGYVIMGLR